jgi:hypothetical protein
VPAQLPIPLCCLVSFGRPPRRIVGDGDRFCGSSGCQENIPRM